MSQRTQRQARRLPQSRRERRAEQREAEKAAAKRPAAQRSLPLPQIIGGALTVLILAGIIVVGIVRANTASSSSSGSHGAALTNASALKPVASLLSTGSTAPSFTLKDVNGKSFNLAAQRGHPVLLEFFAVWCPHCQHEAPIIERLNKQFAAKGVRVWSILANPYGPNYDNSFGTDTTPATKADLAWFSRTFGEHVTQLVDPNFHVVNESGVSGYPGIYIINKQGVIIHASSGEQTYSTLEQALNKAVSSS
jgi:peroxiredoxin